MANDAQTMKAMRRIATAAILVPAIWACEARNSAAQGWSREPPSPANSALEAMSAMPGPSPSYFPSLPANFVEQSVPIAPGAVFDPAVMPAGYTPMPGPTTSDDSESEPSELEMPPGPNVFSAHRMEPPRPAIYFPSLPGNFADLAQYGEQSAGAGDYPEQQAQFLGNLGTAGPFAADPALRAQPFTLSATRRARRAALRAGMPNRWSITTECLMLTEANEPAGPTIVSDFDDDRPLFNSGDLQGPWGFGPRLAATRYLRGGASAVQIGYFGIFEWNRETTVTGSNDLRLAGDIALATTDYIGADAMTVSYWSQIQNFEVNLVQGFFSARSRWTIGGRYINWLDRLRIESTDLDTFTSDMYVRTTNNLVGGHIGYDGLLDSDLGDFTLRLRGGVFANPASQTTVINDLENSFELRNSSVTTTGIAYLGEAGLFYSFSPDDGIDFRFGYNVMWFEGLSRAPQNLDLTDTVDSSTTVENGGSAILHGLTAGATFNW